MAYHKYIGIDSREVVCSYPVETSIEAGISVEYDLDDNGIYHILNFHYLAELDPTKNPSQIIEKTKSMRIDEKNINMLFTMVEHMKSRIEKQKQNQASIENADKTANFVWEYKFVDWANEYDFAKLGQEGWEYVSLKSFHSKIDTFIFKRQVLKPNL